MEIEPFFEYFPRLIGALFLFNRKEIQSSFHDFICKLGSVSGRILGRSALKG